MLNDIEGNTRNRFNALNACQQLLIFSLWLTVYTDADTVNSEYETSLKVAIQNKKYFAFMFNNSPELLTESGFFCWLNKQLEV